MSKEMQKTIDSLRESLAFNGFLVSLLTMKTFYPQTWYKSYDPKLLLEALDYHIARLSESSNIIATPVGLGAMAIIYQERVDGQAWPNYGEILTALKNDIAANWDGIPVKRRTLDDSTREEDDAEGIFEQPSTTQ